MPIQTGQTYTARNQGTAITPQDVAVTVVWLDGENVHYRKEGEALVRQTPLARFVEIIGCTAA